MIISAIISEYNPLHNGHKYHINKTKELTSSQGIISIMSGNFVQRGGPSIIDKWTRAKMALNAGADLVLELPTPYSLGSAERFAKGAIYILNSLNVVNYLSFGSELGNVEILNYIAKTLLKEDKLFKKLLQSEINIGNSYVKARSNALLNYFKEKDLDFLVEDVLNSSNNILGIEYLKALNLFKSSIVPITLKRLGGEYNSLDLVENNYSSATALRNLLKFNRDFSSFKTHIPIENHKIFNSLLSSNYDFAFEEKLFPYVKYKILTKKRDLLNIEDVNEGINNRIYEEAKHSINYDELIKNIKSKRYTYTRINRILTRFFVGFEEYRNINYILPHYIRILGFNDTGKSILKLIKKNESNSIKLFTKLPKEKDDFLKLELQASRAYSIVNIDYDILSEYKNNPIII